MYCALKIVFVVMFKKAEIRGACLARLEEHATLDLRVLSLSPGMGVEITKKNKRILNKKQIKTF